LVVKSQHYTRVMSCNITKHIGRKCKDSQGGIKTVYLFPFVKYSRSQIVLDGQRLASFPSTTVFDWHSIASNFSENQSFDSGSIVWDQNLTIQIPKTNLDSEVYKLANKDYRAIYIDEIGNIRILGLFNGLEATISNETGQEKADFNGYKITLTGKEDNQAYFISNLEGTGFDPFIIYNFIYDNGDNIVMDNGSNFILD